MLAYYSDDRYYADYTLLIACSHDRYYADYTLRERCEKQLEQVLQLLRAEPSLVYIIDIVCVCVCVCMCVCMCMCVCVL